MRCVIFKVALARVWGCRWGTAALHRSGAPRVALDARSRNRTRCTIPAMFSVRALLCSLLPVALALSVHAAEWPEGQDIAEGTTSPNGRYGVLLPSRLEADALDDDAIKNTLVDIKTHRRLAVVRGAHYFPGQNHRDLRAAWAPDSSWCVVTYEGRYGFDVITLVDLQGGTPRQIDFGQHIQKALDGIIAKQAGSKDAGGYGIAHFRAGAGREILVRATAYTNPKAFDDQPTYCALFLGTFDLVTGKWTRSDARKIVSGQNDALETAFMNGLDEGITFNEEKDRLSWFDDRLNEVYSAVRIVLPAERFAAVKKEQVAWLKQLEMQDSVEKKCKLIGARIKELRALVW